MVLLEVLYCMVLYCIVINFNVTGSAPHRPEPAIYMKWII